MFIEKVKFVRGELQLFTGLLNPLVATKDITAKKSTAWQKTFSRLTVA